MKRSITLKLQLSKEQEKILSELADLGAKVWNKVTYLRRQQYFQGQIIDFNKTEKTVYEGFKHEIGSATVQQIARKNAEAWRSFFSLLRKKRNGELPNWLKPKPPNYLKKKEKEKALNRPPERPVQDRKEQADSERPREIQTLESSIQGKNSL